jgi:hypothetical protein
MMLLSRDPAARLDEVRASLQESERNLEARRAELGIAVADGDEPTAAKLRREVASLEGRVAELTAAMPVAENRVREAKERAEAARRAEIAKQEAAARRKRIAAAAKVDAAWQELARAFAELEIAGREVTGPAGLRLAQRTKLAHRAAAYHWAPDLCRALNAEPVPIPQRRPLAQLEADLGPKETA